jgi:hypothetical protein
MEDVNIHISSTGNDQHQAHPGNGQKHHSGSIPETGNSVIRISLQEKKIWLTAAHDHKANGQVRGKNGMRDEYRAQWVQNGIF